jgi:hypothetical protein
MRKARVKPILRVRDGNAFAILGAAKTALKEVGRGDEWHKFKDEATSSDYDHLLYVCDQWFRTETGE